MAGKPQDCDRHGYSTSLVYTVLLETRRRFLQSQSVCGRTIAEFLSQNFASDRLARPWGPGPRDSVGLAPKGAIEGGLRTQKLVIQHVINGLIDHSLLKQLHQQRIKFI